MSRFRPVGFEKLKVDTRDPVTIEVDLSKEADKYKNSEFSSYNIMDLLEFYKGKPLVNFELHIRSLISAGLDKSNIEWVTYAGIYEMPEHLNVLLNLGFSHQQAGQDNVIFDLVDGNVVQSVRVFLDFIGDERIYSITNRVGQNVTEIVKKTSLEMIGLFKSRGWAVQTDPETHNAALAAYKALKEDENSSSVAGANWCVSAEAATFYPSSAAGAMAGGSGAPEVHDPVPMYSRFAEGNQRVVDGEVIGSIPLLLGQLQEEFRHGSEDDF